MRGEVRGVRTEKIMGANVCRGPLCSGFSQHVSLLTPTRLTL